MGSPLFEKIGKSIAKSKGPMPADPMDDSEMPEDGADDDESTESPGAKLIEALGIKDADSDAVDAALKAAIAKFAP
jgi:hypothetical protein